MKSILTIALSAAVLLAGSPAFAQPSGPPDLREQEDRLMESIRSGIDERRIDRREADRAFGELRAFDNQEREIIDRNRGMITARDMDYLRNRLAEIGRDIHWMREEGRNEPPPPPPIERGRDFGSFWANAPAEIHERIEWLERQIDSGIRDGSLNRGEADRGIRGLQAVRATEANYIRRDRGRLSVEHQAILENRLQDLSRQLHWMRTNDR